MNHTFSGWIDSFLTVYLDDILIFSRDADTHEQHLRQVLQRLRESGLKAKKKKCVFGTHEVDYLGHWVGSGKRWMDPAKVEAVL